MSRCNWKKENDDPHPIFLRIILLFFMLLPIGTITLHAQPTLKEVVEGTAKKTEEVKVDFATVGEVPDDEFNRGVPRTMVQGFFLAVRERDFEKAAEYLDLRHLPEAVKKIPGAELAREFRIVLARTIWIELSDLSLDPEGHDKDGLPPYRARVGRPGCTDPHRT